MKHNTGITIILVSVFLLAQFIGLLIVNHYIDHKATLETETVQYKKLPYNFERPEVKNKSISFIPLMIGILVGTALFLLIAKFRKPLFLKFWLFLTIWLTLSLAFNVFLKSTPAAIAAFIFAFLRIFKPNVVIHNFTEVFIYGGLAAFIVPIFNIFAAVMLLIIGSVYDAIAVWKTRHMVALAEFQKKSKLFAGIFISYNKEKNSKTEFFPKKSSKLRPSAAILGGGDIGFPLIFAGVVMGDLMLKNDVLTGFLKVSIIPIFTAITLLVLLFKGEKDKYYPAMPFLSIGAILGYIIILLI